jgi:hypothetical protein
MNCSNFSLRVLFYSLPVTIATRSRASTVFSSSDAGIAGSNPTHGVDVWCVCVFILCLCCFVFS